MHEMSLIERVVSIVEDSVKQEGISKVTKVKLVIGQQKMALPDALQMAFETFIDQAPFVPETVLEIEEREVILHCQDCGQDFKPSSEYNYRCPHCDSGNSHFVQGREFFVEYYEGD